MISIPRENTVSPSSLDDLIKHCKTTLLLPLHEFIRQCWQEGAVPQDTRDSKIITLYKNKGERNDCNNYRGISLLSIVYKVFARSYWYASRSCRSHNVASELKVNNRHDLLPSTAIREVQGTADSLVHWCRAWSSLSTLTRREQCSPMAAPRSHLKSAAASNKAASLRKRSLGLSLACC